MNPLSCFMGANELKDMMIDGNLIQSAAHLHDILARELSLPLWYGRNLDALHDCLTERAEETVITVVNLDQMEAQLQQYCRCLIRVLRDSAAENPHLQLYIR